VVTLPLLLSLTAGTALGAFLRQNTWLVLGASIGLFIGGFFLAARWLGQPTPVADTRTRRPRPRHERTPAPIQHVSNGRLDKTVGSSLSRPRHKRPKVTLVYGPSCPTCPQVQTTWRELQEQIGFDYEEVDITTAQGRELAVTYGIMHTPVTLIDGQVTFRGEPSWDEALSAVRSGAM
jgi:glutaredoxin